MKRNILMLYQKSIHIGRCTERTQIWQKRVEEMTQLLRNWAAKCRMVADEVATLLWWVGKRFAAQLTLGFHLNVDCTLPCISLLRGRIQRALRLLRSIVVQPRWVISHKRDLACEFCWQILFHKGNTLHMAGKCSASSLSPAAVAASLWQKAEEANARLKWLTIVRPWTLMCRY